MNFFEHIPDEDLALYAMQALTPDEMRKAQEHLDQCTHCRAGLAEALGDIALIGLSVDQEPLPEGVKERFLQKIDEETARIQAMSTYPKAVRQKSYGWIGWLAAAACLAIAAYFGIHSFDLQQRLNTAAGQTAELAAQAERAQIILDVLTSKQAVHVTLTETKQPAQPSGNATYLQDRGALIFYGHNLHPLPSGKIYELWLIPQNGKPPIPAGTFRPDPSGSASVILPPIPPGTPAKAFGITIEPAEGSSAPTLPIIMSGQ